MIPAAGQNCVIGKGKIFRKQGKIIIASVFKLEDGACYVADHGLIDLIIKK